MTFLQNTTLLPSTSHAGFLAPSRKQEDAPKAFQSSLSIASLVGFVRSPVNIIRDVVESRYDAHGSTLEECARKQSQDDQKQILHLKLAEATSYEAWQAIATELDEIEGNSVWKSTFESPEYDAALVQARLKQLDEARISCDVGRMIFLIRTALTRGLGDMGNIKLYRHSYTGTKDLIERYNTSALETLDALLDISAKAKCDAIETKHILDQVLSTRQAFGRSALLLSGGGAFGMNHTGVIKALWHARLLPRIISGASAGSIVAATMATRTEEELPIYLEECSYGDLAVFGPPEADEGILRKVTRLLKYGNLFDICHLSKVMRDLMGDMTFQECYNRTRKILNICVSTASVYELPRLLNYITAPNVLIWSAVAASCSVPLIFSAATLLAKDPKTGENVPWNPSPKQWIDGSIETDLPMTRLSEMFNVNHFIVSQVNPHVIPFVNRGQDSVNLEPASFDSSPSFGSGWLPSLTTLAKEEALHRMQFLAEMGVFPNTLTKVVSILSQKYTGDITIFPEIEIIKFPRLLSNPSPQFMVEAIQLGERATWPKLSRIKNHCAIELALDDAVHKLRARVVFSPSQIDLRLRSHTRSHNELRKGSKSKGKGGKRPSSLNESKRPSSLNDTSHSATTKFPTGRRATQPVKAPVITNTVGPAPENPPSPRTAPPHFSNPLYDIVSSGAETSGVSTSASSADESSSPPESPSSPTSTSHWQIPPRPDLPQYSTASPLHASISNFLAHQAPTSHSNQSSRTLAPRKASLSTASAKSQCMMAKVTPPSPPEGKFKRLFQHRSSRRQSETSDSLPSGQNAAPSKKVLGLGIEEEEQDVGWERGE